MVVDRKIIGWCRPLAWAIPACIGAFLLGTHWDDSRLEASRSDLPPLERIMSKDGSSDRLEFSSASPEMNAKVAAVCGAYPDVLPETLNPNQPYHELHLPVRVGSSHRTPRRRPSAQRQHRNLRFL